MDAALARGPARPPSTSGQRLRARRIAARAAAQLVGAVEQPDERWLRQSLLRRQLRVAVDEQQYVRAAELRDRLAALRSELPPQQQFVAAQLQKLDWGSPEEQQAAMRAIGEVGGMDVLGEVAEWLRCGTLDRAAARALSQIWHRHPGGDAAIGELMGECCRLLAAASGGGGPGAGLSSLVQAEKLCSQMILLDPSFAEAWNKRATCRFLLGQFQESKYRDSLDDCQLTMGMNPYHFGCLTGMGLCHMRLRENESALHSFRRALQVYPGMEGVRVYLRALQQQDGRDSAPM